MIYITLLPGETLTEHSTIPLTGLRAGKTYCLKVELEGYPDTAITATIIPQPL